MPDNIQTRIKQRRQELGLSQDMLAKACNVGQSTVANWERGGHIPRQATIHKIAKALKTEEVWLLSGEYSAQHRPTNSYLARPIRHVATYNWPKNKVEFDNAVPETFIALTTDQEHAFALLLNQDRHFEGGKFETGAALIFTADTSYSEHGIYLYLTDRDCRLSLEHSSDCTARLLYSITPH